MAKNGPYRAAKLSKAGTDKIPLPPLPFPSPLLSFPPFPSTSPSPSLPLEVGPLNPARSLGEHCNLPQRVRVEPGRRMDLGEFICKAVPQTTTGRPAAWHSDRETGTEKCLNSVPLQRL